MSDRNENIIIYSMLYQSDSEPIRGALTALKTPLPSLTGAAVQGAYKAALDKFSIGKLYEELVRHDLDPDDIIMRDYGPFNIKEIVYAALHLNSVYYASEVHKLAGKMARGEIHPSQLGGLVEFMVAGSENEYKLIDKAEGYDLVANDEAVNDHLTYGFKNLDKYTGGIRRSRMTIVAARPGIGKSDVALHIARENLKVGRNILIASIEMDKREILHRLALPEGRGWYETPEEEKEMKLDGLRRIRDEYPGQYYIYDKPSMTVSDVLHLVDDKIDMVILDYLQILTAEGWHRSEYEKISDFSNSLRAAAKSTNAAWLVLSQLSRPSDKKGAETQVPGLPDLRGSGSLEQDAYAVMLMNLDGERVKKGEQPVLLTVAKNRGGNTGKQRALVNRQAHLWREA